MSLLRVSADMIKLRNGKTVAEALDDMILDVSADNVDLDNPNFTSNNLNDGMTELFTNVSDGKNSIASAITDMNQSASGSDTFAQLSAKIKNISMDADAQINHVLTGKTFYEGGIKRVGTMLDHGGATMPVGGNETQGVRAHPTNGDYGQLVTNINRVGYYNTSTRLEVNIHNLTASNIKHGVSIGRADGSANSIVGTFTSTTAGATAGQILAGRVAFANGAQINGTMPNRTGHVTGQSVARSGTTVRIRPQAGYYPGDTGNSVQISDANFVAGNIRSGVSIFGLAGSMPLSTSRESTITYSAETIDVVFDTPMPNTNYNVVIDIRLDYGVPKDAYTISNKTVNGFRINNRMGYGLGVGSLISNDNIPEPLSNFRLFSYSPPVGRAYYLDSYQSINQGSTQYLEITFHKDRFGIDHSYMTLDGEFYGTKLGAFYEGTSNSGRIVGVAMKKDSGDLEIGFVQNTGTLMRSWTSPTPFSGNSRFTFNNNVFYLWDGYSRKLERRNASGAILSSINLPATDPSTNVSVSFDDYFSIDLNNTLYCIGKTVDDTIMYVLNATSGVIIDRVVLGGSTRSNYSYFLPNRNVTISLNGGDNYASIYNCYIPNTKVVAYSN